MLRLLRNWFIRRFGKRARGYAFAKHEHEKLGTSLLFMIANVEQCRMMGIADEFENGMDEYITQKLKE